MCLTGYRHARVIDDQNLLLPTFLGVNVQGPIKTLGDHSIWSWGTENTLTHD